MPGPVFICGATGTQGGAVARHLRLANVPVHAIVRDPTSTKAIKLKDLGVTIFPGSFEDDAGLKAALKDTTSAFLNFVPSFADFTHELQQAKAVAAAAKDAGVKHVVYSSSFGLDERQEPAFDLDPEGLVAKVYRVKRDIIGAVISAGFESYTILRPGKFMSDLWGPGSVWFGDLTKTGTFETALRRGEPSPWVDPDDIGTFGAAALLDPKKFGGRKIDIFTEMLAIDEVIGMLAKTLGKKLGLRFLTEEEEEERKKAGDIFVQAQVVMRDKGVDISVEGIKPWGVPLGSYHAFLEREKAQLLKTYSHIPNVE